MAARCRPHPTARRTSSSSSSTTSATPSSAATGPTSPRPDFDALAAGGHRYSNFHTTALCSPTRACLLTGRNHHSQRHGPHRGVRGGLPRLQRDHPARERLPVRDPRARTATPRSRSASGTSRPATEMHDGQPAATRWPLGRGLRALLRVPRRRDRPVPPGRSSTTTTTSSPRRPPRRATTSPRTWPTRPSLFLKDLRATPARQAVLPLVHPRRLPRPAPGARRATSSATGASSTRAGTRGATRSSPGRSRRGSCPPAHRLSRAAVLGARLGLPRPRTSSTSTPG